ncbi:alcohol dehydrogenase [Bosea sp. (in: a-proteobacteria)]|jgi:propanol-preferring alcohol dehydrogenase|uniref:alcohol dehydrogenase n=1 Tax=Bosea sp. (in: a-proteobacteria) TaxID=1871050 RepID=UPI002DDCB46A|nr:alcohol dehydrogenase [Bosea sp. (in: a-proteobacteria)]HEV2512101.1 alcohol dehydrogenase [Bosea sp. (in: a-proteobacteria)]
MRRMRCYQVNEFGGSIEPAEIELPPLRGAQVRLRVIAAGLCHSDVHICEGHYDLGGGRKITFADRIKFPRVLGHEVSGEIVELGPEARGVAIGDVCLVCSWIGCGECEQCAQGLENLCLKPQFVGVNRDGGFAEFVDVPHPDYLIDLKGLDPVAAAPMVCSGLTTYSALKKFGPLAGRRPVVIIGAGGLGLIAIAIARMLDAAGVVVVELDAAKRQAALDAGALAAIAPGDGATDGIRQAVGGSVWAVLDLVGSGATAQLAVDVLDKTGKLVVVGLFGGAVELPVPMLPLKVLTIQGSYTGSPAELRDFVALAHAKGLPSAPLDRRPLSAAPVALRDLKEGRVVGRVILQP